MNHHVVIVGSGFGGLYAAKALGSKPVLVSIIDRRNFHLFQPLLYQVATGGLSPGDIASPVRSVLHKHKNIRALVAEVVDLDPEAKRVIMRDGELNYDSLILSTGVRHDYFGKPEWERMAPGLKTVEDALRIRSHIFQAFEQAEREQDAEARKAWMTFVIVGGGPTGVELAGAVAELAHSTLKDDFRNIDPGQSQILLIESGDRILQNYTPELSIQATKALERLGVTVVLYTKVTDIHEQSVTLKHQDDLEEKPARTVLWGAGVKASPLGAVVANRFGATLDRAGRVMVNENMTVGNDPNVFVIGDLSHAVSADGSQLPGIAPVAMQQGKYVAQSILNRLEGKQTGPFRYRDKGTLAVIGRNSAVAMMSRLRLHGFIAWLTWVFVHLFYLIEFDNKVLVLFQWAWNYFTRKKGARLITGEADLTLEPAVSSLKGSVPRDKHDAGSVQQS